MMIKKTKKTKKFAKPGKNYDTVAVTMLVDESQSMAHLFLPTCAGFNEYVDVLKDRKRARPTFFTAITFDTRGMRKLQVGAPLKDAITLGAHNYKPTGGTPLLDAVATAIMATEEVMAKEHCRKVIVVIQTDGEENSSLLHKLPAIKAMIELRQAKGWQFVFIGAGINAFADAQSMGISTINTMSYAATAEGTEAVFRATAQNTQAYASGALENMGYSQNQSMQSGESAQIWQQKMAAAQKPTAQVVIKATLSR